MNILINNISIKQNLILRLKNKLESFIDITYFKKIRLLIDLRLKLGASIHHLRLWKKNLTITSKEI